MHRPGYETGEFSKAAARTLEETNVLIKDYPWQEDCAVTYVGLEMAGVVIENGAGGYLKIGNYFHSQYKLYLYTARKYYLKIVRTIEDALAIVADFFNGKDITAVFNKEWDWAVKKHFVSKDFIYKVTGLRILWFMLLTIMFSIPFTFFLIAFIGSPYCFGMFLIWLFICGINWLLFINYFFQSWNLFLKVSEGQRKFLFGTRSNYQEYDKDDIDRFYIYACKGGSKGPPWYGFEVYKMVFKDGTEIRFTSLLIGSLKMLFKFSDVPTTNVRKFLPFSKMGKVVRK